MMSKGVARTFKQLPWTGLPADWQAPQGPRRSPPRSFGAGAKRRGAHSLVTLITSSGDVTPSATSRRLSSIASPSTPPAPTDADCSRTPRLSRDASTSGASCASTCLARANSTCDCSDCGAPGRRHRSASSSALSPGGASSRSTMVTAWPRRARNSDADRPAKPPPAITICDMAPSCSTAMGAQSTSTRHEGNYPTSLPKPARARIGRRPLARRSGFRRGAREERRLIWGRLAPADPTCTRRSASTRS